MKYRMIATLWILGLCSSVMSDETSQPDGNESANTPPIISDLPVPVIGDLDGATGSNHFVFEDVFQLNTFVTDDFTTDGGILWSYDIMGTPIYAINSTPVLDGDDPTSPPESKQIQRHLDPADFDLDPYTITLRDIVFTPDDATTPTDPGPAGIVHSQVVTFWASDGTTASNKSTIFYTDNDGDDRFSGGFDGGFPVPDFTTGALGWTVHEFVDEFDNTRGAQSASGLCVTTAKSANAMIRWISDPVTYYDLVDNRIYSISFNMTSTSMMGEQPLVQFVVNNTAGTVEDGYAYGGEFFIVDQHGGANSIANRYGGAFWWYYCPPQVQVPGWRSSDGGAFDPVNASNRNYRIEMNIFDLDGVLEGETRSGTVCLTSLTIETIPINSLYAGEEVYGISPGQFNQNNFGWHNEVNVNGRLDHQIAQGNLVITATSATLNLAVMTPGDQPYAPDVEHFPIPVIADQFYKIEWTVTSSPGTYPIEILRLQSTTPTYEILQNSYAAVASNTLGFSALPPMDETPVTYTMFYNPHTVSLDTSVPANWRTELAVANREDINGALAADNTLTFSRVSVVPVRKSRF